MTTHHPKFSMHTALQLVGLTTEKLLSTALTSTNHVCFRVVLYYTNHAAYNFDTCVSLTTLSILINN